MNRNQISMQANVAVSTQSLEQYVAQLQSWAAARGVTFREEPAGHWSWRNEKANTCWVGSYLTHTDALVTAFEMDGSFESVVANRTRLEREAMRPVGYSVSSDTPANDAAPQATIANTAVVQTRVKKVYLEASAASEFGEGPEWAEITNPLFLLAKVRSLQKSVLELGLTEARISLGPDAWGPPAAHETLRLAGDELVVTPKGFWLSCVPKGADYDCETRMEHTDLFERALVEADSDELYLGPNASLLQERVRCYAEAAVGA